MNTTTIRITSAHVKAELRKKFPGVKFSVRSDVYSLNIRWELGPTKEQVEAITWKYKDGRFDGMTDSYEYRARTAEAPGGWNYVFCKREIPKDLEARALADLCALTDTPTPADHNTRIDGEYASSLVRAAFWHVSFMGKEYAGIDYDNETIGTRFRVLTKEV